MTTLGVAGTRVPELGAIFLCESEHDVELFTNMARVPSAGRQVGSSLSSRSRQRSASSSIRRWVVETSDFCTLKI